MGKIYFRKVFPLKPVRQNCVFSLTLAKNFYSKDFQNENSIEKHKSALKLYNLTSMMLRIFFNKLTADEEESSERRAFIEIKCQLFEKNLINILMNTQAEANLWLM